MNAPTPNIPRVLFLRIVSGEGWSAAEFSDESAYGAQPRLFRMNKESLHDAIDNFSRYPNAEAKTRVKEYSRALQKLLEHSKQNLHKP